VRGTMLLALGLTAARNASFVLMQAAGGDRGRDISCLMPPHRPGRGAYYASGSYFG